MNNLSVAQRAYMAGFLDGDGSVYVRLKPNKAYKYQYQVAPNIVFFQSMKDRRGLEKMQQITGVGYLRNRKDGIVEYTIGDMSSMVALLKSIYPYLCLKKRQAKLMMRILNSKEKVKNVNDFLKLCSLIDRFQQLNYSKRRIQTYSAVEKTLRNEGLLTP